MKGRSVILHRPLHLTSPQGQLDETLDERERSNENFIKVLQGIIPRTQR